MGQRVCFAGRSCSLGSVYLGVNPDARRLLQPVNFTLGVCGDTVRYGSLIRTHACSDSKGTAVLPSGCGSVCKKASVCRCVSVRTDSALIVFGHTKDTEGHILVCIIKSFYSFYGKFF